MAHSPDITTSVQTVLTHAPDEATVHLLANTVYGTPNSLQYKHLYTSDKIRKAKDIAFLRLIRKGKVLANAGFRMANWRTSGVDYRTVYVRYLSFPGTFLQYKRTATGSKFNGIHQSKLQQSVETLLASEFETDKNQPTFYYAIVEGENRLSGQLCQRFGFEKIREMSTLLFSRFYPKKWTGVRALRESELPSYKEMVAAFYEGYACYFSGIDPVLNSILVYEKNGEIVAGLQAIPVVWEMVNVPGFTGFLMLSILPKIPVLANIFVGKILKFAAFDALWFKKGHEKELIQLMESTLAHLHVHVGMHWSDAASPTHANLKANGNMGLLNTLQKNVPAHIMARFVHTTAQQKEEVTKRCMYISAADIV